MNLLLTLIVALFPLCAPGGDVEVIVRTKEGVESSGTLSATTIRIKMKLGELIMEMDTISSISFGSPDAVTMRDGTKVVGRVLTDKFIIKSKAGSQTLAASSLARLSTNKPPKPLAGEIVDGVASNQMLYHLRMPRNYDPKTPRNAIVIFHGSNMNSKNYVSTIAGTWPKLADDYIIIGIDGENRVKESSDEDPAFNYTYVDFVGKSRFKGFPGTDRESPALVAEALAELQKQLSIKKYFVGGHSQGGYLTYSILMNYPELIAGAFPVSAGVIFQCEPSAYDNATVRAAQRRLPVAIVHAENDGIVQFSMGKDASEIFEDDGFGMVRLFTSKTAAHMFGMLPIEEAVRWLESLSADDPESLITFATRAAGESRVRDAVCALRRAAELDKNGKLKQRIADQLDPIEKQASAAASKIAGSMDAAAGGPWVDEFLKFREQFGLCAAAAPVIGKFMEIRSKHQKPADDLVAAARADFQNNKSSDAYIKYAEVRDKYFASNWYRRVCRWIAERK
ncbi:MAG: hypothetical protein HY286_13720 [Planctomycetes bacterium]|nr:hypothetical protein [Planctomycetota bacterium]